MKRSESIADLAAALVKAQAQIKPALKDSENPFFKSKYADLSSAWLACRDALQENGLAVVQFPISTEEGIGVETMLVHASGQWLSGEYVLPMAKQDPQGGGSCITYSRRYALMAVVGICPEDDDGQGAAKSVADLRKLALDILQPAAKKGLPALEIAWKTVSADMRKVCAKDLAGLKDEAARVKGGNGAVATA